MIQFTQDNIQSGFALSDDVFGGLKVYHNLLIKWQKAINIVSKKTLDEAWHRHFADSAQISRLIPQDKHGGIYADLGCGGGFPGLVVALMRPELEVHLVESDERKGQFMRTVIRETDITNAHVHTQRIEDIADEFTPDYISARALAALPKLLDYCQGWIKANPDVCFYFLKGEQALEEIEAARLSYDFSATTTPSITDERAQILYLKKVRVS
ncbi:MAG: 16S rRNA (guanine(527)-N(7))-methyltransferase RsmG [Alphaproteobacteria bacterium]|nr:16S rRNA (guanine(527)-N(7))-methyltransferase RsmG [Alphaproteobacteria bacterium]